MSFDEFGDTPVEGGFDVAELGAGSDTLTLSIETSEESTSNLTVADAALAEGIDAVGPDRTAAIARESYRSFRDSASDATGGRDGEKKTDRGIDHFVQASTAAAYNQQISLNVGGQTATASLRDIRDVASTKYNSYSRQVQQLREQGASKSRIDRALRGMNFFADVMAMSDAVARGEISPEVLRQYIEKNEEFSPELTDEVTGLTVARMSHSEGASEGRYQGLSDVDQDASAVLQDFGSNASDLALGIGLSPDQIGSTFELASTGDVDLDGVVLDLGDSGPMIPDPAIRVTPV